MNALSYSAEQVRRYDHDRFLTVIFAPAADREPLFALYAFNLEIAKTREVVTEPLIGQMRLQWWRDALDRLYDGQPLAHGVAQPLGEAIGRTRPDRAAFDRLIDAREADLDDAPVADLAALEAYAAATGGALTELALRILSDRADGAEAARLVGTAWALTGLMRAVPFHASGRRLYLPRDRLEQEGVRVGRLFEGRLCEGEAEPGLCRVVHEIARTAADHLRRARRLTGTVPRRLRSPLLLARLADLHLADLARAGWNPFAPGLAAGRPLAVARLAIPAILGRF
jgi:phytoene synthase